MFGFQKCCCNDVRIDDGDSSDSKWVPLMKIWFFFSSTTSVQKKNKTLFSVIFLDVGVVDVLLRPGNSVYELYIACYLFCLIMQNNGIILSLGERY